MVRQTDDCSSGERKACICDLCNACFSSKTKLFRHLEQHGYIPNNKFDKVVVLFGWLASADASDDDVWTKNDTSSKVEVDLTSYEVALYSAISAVEQEGILNEPSDGFNRPKGLSRSCSSILRNGYAVSLEDTTHGMCETICYQSPRRATLIPVETWLENVNTRLPAFVRVLSRTVLPSTVPDFHAEINCTQRRFEYLLPLNVVMPPELAMQPREPILRRRKHAGANAEMDDTFPSDTLEGQARIEYFRRLKRLLKTFAGRRLLHNFASGGMCPDDLTVHRKIDRFYHKDIFCLEGTDWVVFSISGDCFVRGEVRRLVGLVVAVMRGWIPFDYFEWATSKDVLVDVPALPGRLCSIAESRFAFFEATYQDVRLDPRRRLSREANPAGSGTREDVDTDAEYSSRGQSAVQRMETWRSSVLEHIVRAVVSESPGAEAAENDSVDRWTEDNCSWLRNFKQSCIDAAAKHAALKTLLDRPPAVLKAALCRETEKTEGCDVNLRVPEVYREALHYLRAADASGLWPSSSTLRRKVIHGETLVEEGGRGGSFSVGALPKSLPAPKGNSLFPELMLACFRLERALRPGRPPSSTIAINRHAQFKPHRDTGVGHGQSISLIVALGDFAGGEVVVETTPHDIRYQPLDFDGWSQRHWTLPFVGERFSLVWFTPMGVEPQDLWWNLLDPVVEGNERASVLVEDSCDETREMK